MNLGKHVCIEVCCLSNYLGNEFKLFEIGMIIDIHCINICYYIFVDIENQGAYDVSDIVYNRNFKLMSEYRNDRINEILDV